MKRHPAMAASIRPGSKGPDTESLARPNGAGDERGSAAQHLELTAGVAAARKAIRPSARSRPSHKTHTLVLSGGLDRFSTHMLEAEIERLCASGIKQITLDLTHLSGIDTTGVAVIVFRGKWCRRRGCELVLIRGGHHIQRAFELAGVADVLPYQEAGAAIA